MANPYDYQINYHNYALVEIYEGLRIIKSHQNHLYTIKEFPSLYLSTVEVARKCIDVYLKHKKERELPITNFHSLG